jgi:hypothetical protein
MRDVDEAMPPLDVPDVIGPKLGPSVEMLFFETPPPFQPYLSWPTGSWRNFYHPPRLVRRRIDSSHAKHAPAE